MTSPIQTVELELAKRSLYRVPDEARQVTVRSGTLWLTQRDDPRDIILEPGQSFTPDGARQVVLYALAPAAFSVHSAAGTHAPQRPVRQCRSARELVLEQDAP